MSEAKHTPGPWSVPHFARPEAGCDCAYVLSDGFMGAVCTVTVSKDGDDPPIEQAVANAHLIAAAPDLLAALKAQEIVDEIGVSQSASIEAWRELRDQARSMRTAAIAKAKGRSK